MRNNGELVISTHHPFTDYLSLNKNSYFEKRLVEETWGRNSESPFTVNYYTRSLTDVLNPIIESQFDIVSIEEPLPDENIKRLSPKKYERLSTSPGFLFVVLRR